MSTISDEESTFNRLKRTPFQEVRAKVRALNIAKDAHRTAPAAIQKLLRETGWNTKTYQTELAKYVSGIIL